MDRPLKEYYEQQVSLLLDVLLFLRQNTLPNQVVAALTDDHRKFLIGFKSGNPDWGLLPFDHIQNLPAVRWKQQKLEKMGGIKREKEIEKLQQIFDAIH